VENIDENESTVHKNKPRLERQIEIEKKGGYLLNYYLNMDM
jgi:hypothetical protein